MDRVVLLKTQLVEAAKFVNSNTYSYKRLAVILLDNFIEIQLSTLIKQKFYRDGIPFYKEKKYSEEKRKKILKHHDVLLKACVEEKLINTDEQKLISYCHDVRNNLYHKTDEDVLLVDVALIILHQIIQLRQPKWKTARGFTRYGKDFIDPFASESHKVGFFSGNETADWECFLSKYFIFNEIDKWNGSRILSEYLLEKIKNVRESIRFIKENDWAYFFPGAKDWEYNDFLKYYSFLNIKKEEIEKIKEIKDKDERRMASEKLRLAYFNSWRYRKESRLNALERSIQKIALAPISKGLEKYISLREEVTIIYEAFSHASGELDGAIQHAIDVARGK